MYENKDEPGYYDVHLCHELNWLGWIVQCFCLWMVIRSWRQRIKIKLGVLHHRPLYAHQSKNVSTNIITTHILYLLDCMFHECSLVSAKDRNHMIWVSNSCCLCDGSLLVSIFFILFGMWGYSKMNLRWSTFRGLIYAKLCLIHACLHQIIARNQDDVLGKGTALTPKLFVTHVASPCQHHSVDGQS